MKIEIAQWILTWKTGTVPIKNQLFFEGANAFIWYSDNRNLQADFWQNESYAHDNLGTYSLCTKHHFGSIRKLEKTFFLALRVTWENEKVQRISLMKKEKA